MSANRLKIVILYIDKTVIVLYTVYITYEHSKTDKTGGDQDEKELDDNICYHSYRNYSLRDLIHNSAYKER